MAQSSPRGQELAVKLDKAFSDELQEVVPNLSVGEAVVFLRGRPGEKTAPVKILVEKVDKLGNEETAKQLAAKTAKTFLPVVQKKDSKTMLNPVLKYCEVPKPLEQYILYYIWKSKDHTAFQADLLKDLGIDRERVRQIIAKLQADGYIITEKLGNKLKLQYNRGLFMLKGIVENEEGRKVAMKVMKDYMEKGYTIVRGKQEGEIRPDFVAIPYDRSTFRPNYKDAIALEIESPNEVSVHPEQVKKNMIKYMQIKDLFKEIHVWTSEEKFDKLKEIYDSFMNDNSIPADYKQKVKIFAVKLKQKVEQQSKEEQKKVEETGEFNGKREEKAESISNNKQQEITIQGAAANNAQGNGKLGSLTLKDLAIEILSKENGGYIIQINETKYYIKEEYLKILQTAAKDQELIKSISLDKLELKINLGIVDYTIPLAPL